ncbi:MAG: phage tail tube protein, partial [Limisphaerales bacterium]
ANLAATTTFSSSSFRLSPKSNNLKETIEVISDEGLRGTRTRNVERLASGNVKISGPIVFEPTTAELETLMPFILGTASSTGTYAVAETLPTLYLLCDYVSKVATFTGAVNRATFEASPGEKLKLTLDVVGSAMTLGSAGSFASASVPAIDNNPVYRMADMGSGVTINSIAYLIDAFKLTIDNKIVPTYMSGVLPTDLLPTDRVVTLEMRTRYNTADVVLQTDQRAFTKRAGSVAFTNSASDAFTFTFGSLVAPPESVVVPDRNHIRYPSSYLVYGIGSTKELVITLPA